MQKLKVQRGHKKGRRGIRFLFFAFFLLIFGLLLLFVFVNLFIVQGTKKYIYTSLESVPSRYTAIVLGARVYENGSVSFVFRDRIEGGIELLENDVVQKVLISGDHGRRGYDEVNAALQYVKKTHPFVCEEAVFLDHAGFSTYETMYRARDVFCVQNAVIVTQRFHAYRAVYLAKRLGIDAVAYIPPEKNAFSARTKASWQIRESLARVKAFFSLTFHAKPKFLGEKIPIQGSSLPTRDLL